MSRMIITKLQELLKAASPGPWEPILQYDDEDDVNVIRLYSEQGKGIPIFNVGCYYETMSGDQVANATLAAAAPDLAHLVVTLTEALEPFSARGASASYVEGYPPIAKARKALTAVEKLKLYNQKGIISQVAADG